MSFRKFFGTIFIIFGSLNLLNFWAPQPVPTFGPSAFIIGLLFIGTGLYLRANRDASGKIRWDKLKALLSNARTRKNSSLGRSTGTEDETDHRFTHDPLLAVEVLRLASSKNGRLTVAQTAMELNVPIDQAESALDECASRGSAYIDVDETSGLASYRFPEFIKDQG